MSWAEVKLGELGEFRNGLNYSRANEGRGLKVISVKDFGSLRVPNFDDLDEINPQGLSVALSMLEAGDVIFVRSNGNKDLIGRSMLIETKQENVSFSGFCIRFRNTSDQAYSKFLAYHFRSPVFRKTLSSLGGGTNINNLNQSILHNFNISLPDLPTQTRIASILSAYDDLIENNRRRTRLLEQAARLLYREWFVHFRFPSHETAKFVDGLPEGWEKKRIGDITTKLGSGATPRGGESAYEPSGMTLIRSLNVYDFSFHDDGLAFINQDQAKKLANVAVESQDVLINITGASVARCCMVPERHLPARVNQHVMIVRVDPQKCSAFFVLHSINAHQNKERLLSIARAGGATREAITKDTMSGFEILCAPQDLVKNFHIKCAAMHEQAELLSAQNVKLTRARDLLLPRLMDGRLPV